MKSLTIVALVGLISGTITPAYADDDDNNSQDHGYFVEHDAKGQRTGTIEEESPGYMVERNTKGLRVGTIEREGDQWIQRDLTGKRVGTIERQ